MRPRLRSRRLVAAGEARCWLSAGAFWITVAVTRAASAGGAAADAYDDVRPIAPIDVHGLLDVYAQHGLGGPPGMLQLRAYDPKNDAPSVGYARLTLAHKPHRVGFRLDAGVGDIADGYMRSDPAAAAYPRLSRALSYVEQAFVTAQWPDARGVSVDVGKFGTPLGLEDNETPRNWSYSRSLPYTWGEPTTHTGVRVTVAATYAIDLSAFWVNGWNANVVGGDGMRSFACAASWRLTPRLILSATYMGGLERDPQRLDDPALAFRHELDGFATYSPGDRVTFAVTADYARDAAHGGVSWWGLAGYVRGLVLPWLAGTLRGEHYADPDGFTTGAQQRLAELTGTIEAQARVADVTLMGRVEYRRDQSDGPVFRDGHGECSLHQDTMALALIAFF